MDEIKTEETLVVIKPDSFWRGLNHQVEGRIKALGLTVVSERTLAGIENLPEEKWREFYFPAIGNRPRDREGGCRWRGNKTRATLLPEDFQRPPACVPKRR